MRKHSLVAIVLVFALAVAATTVVPMSVEKLTAQSTHIVHARALDHHAAWNADHTRIFTLTRFQVVQTLKGAAPGTITVKQLGGHADGYNMKVAGVRYWQTGEDVVLFLQQAPIDGTFTVTGLMQGDFRVARKPSGALVVSNGVPEVRELVASGEVQSYRGTQMTLQELEQRVRKAGGQ